MISMFWLVEMTFEEVAINIWESDVFWDFFGVGGDDGSILDGRRDAELGGLDFGVGEASMGDAGIGQSGEALIEDVFAESVLVGGIDVSQMSAVQQSPIVSLVRLRRDVTEEDDRDVQLVIVGGEHSQIFRLEFAIEIVPVVAHVSQDDCHFTPVHLNIPSSVSIKDTVSMDLTSRTAVSAGASSPWGDGRRWWWDRRMGNRDRRTLPQVWVLVGGPKSAYICRCSASHEVRSLLPMKGLLASVSNSPMTSASRFRIRLAARSKLGQPSLS